MSAATAQRSTEKDFIGSVKTSLTFRQAPTSASRQVPAAESPTRAQSEAANHDPKKSRKLLPRETHRPTEIQPRPHRWPRRQYRSPESSPHVRPDVLTAAQSACSLARIIHH